MQLTLVTIPFVIILLILAVVNHIYLSRLANLTTVDLSVIEEMHEDWTQKPFIEMQV